MWVLIRALSWASVRFKTNKLPQRSAADTCYTGLTGKDHLGSPARVLTRAVKPDKPFRLHHPLFTKQNCKILVIQNCTYQRFFFFFVIISKMIVVLKLLLICPGGSLIITVYILWWSYLCILKFCFILNKSVILKQHVWFNVKMHWPDFYRLQYWCRYLGSGYRRVRSTDPIPVFN